MLQVIRHGLIVEALCWQRRAKTSGPLGREFRRRNELLGIGDTVDEWDDDAVGAAVESS
jgi:hypothetical protein